MDPSLDRLPERLLPQTAPEATPRAGRPRVTDPDAPRVRRRDGVLPKVVELAAGRRFDLALDLAARGFAVTVTDLDPAVLAAPAPLDAFVDDLHRPDVARYRGAALLVARRMPEELQVAAVALARAAGVPLAFRPLKDELAEIGPVRLVEGWRVVDVEARGA